MKTPGLTTLLLGALVLAFAATGCQKDNSATSSALYVPSASDVTNSATLADLQAGRTLYINHCGDCHELYLPESFSATQWRSILPNMTPRTNLTSAEVSLVTKYVTKGK
ncbi:MAG: hypothetical protein HXX13_18320 [Bacteroidetes bacterium]|nr:hypothetical protein [Bacteroidota bacterium]